MHSDRLPSAEVLGESPTPPPVQGSASHLRTNQYAHLKRLIKKNGLPVQQPAYYAGKMAFTLGLLAVSLALLFVLGDTWFQLLNAAYLAFVSVQISLLSHDFGHRQFTFRAPWKNDWLTLVFPSRSACRLSRDPPYQSGVSQCIIMPPFLILLAILLYFS
jgi:ABC-type Na+ efflux pump permease subunit